MLGTALRDATLALETCMNRTHPSRQFNLRAAPQLSLGNEQSSRLFLNSIVVGEIGLTENGEQGPSHSPVIPLD